MRVGRAYADIKRRASEAYTELQQWLEEHAAAAQRRVEEVFTGTAGADSVDETLAADPGNVGEIVAQMEHTAAGLEAEANDLAERISDHIRGFRTESRDLTASAQEEAITRLEEEIRKTAELAQIGLSVEIIEHDLQQVFHGIKSGIGTLRAMLRRSERALEEVDRLRSNFQHFEHQFRQLRPLYRRSYRVKVEITGERILSFVRDFLGHALEVNRVTLDATAAFTSLTIREAPALVLPAFTNLVDNAIYWLRRSEERRVVFDRRADVVTVCDSGPGIHDAMLEEIFEAFVTTRPGGRGLGLYIARQTLALSSHRIWATNDPEFRRLKGACFCLRFHEAGPGDERDATEGEVG
jgi:signal transduction histidine kinase